MSPLEAGAWSWSARDSDSLSYAFVHFCDRSCGVNTLMICQLIKTPFPSIFIHIDFGVLQWAYDSQEPFRVDVGTWPLRKVWSRMPSWIATHRWRSNMEGERKIPVSPQPFWVKRDKMISVVMFFSNTSPPNKLWCIIVAESWLDTSKSYT